MVGILTSKGQGTCGQDQDDVILMPWTTLVRRIIGTRADTVGNIMVSARSPEAVAEAQRDITALLRQRHHTAENADEDFQVRNLAEMQNAAQEQTKTIFQFLTKAVVLATVGGLIGLLLGIGAAKYMAAQAQWPALLSPKVMAGTLLLAGLAGIIAGFYPALRASRLDPIDALRFE